MVPLYKPYMPELPLISEILCSNELSYGKYTRAFEEALKQYFNTPYVLAVNSFSSAVSVALSCYGIAGGDEVIASPMACLASTQPYASSGLKIVWADIDPALGTLNPESVRKNITNKTKLIVHNHFCGYPGYIDEINDIGKEYGILVIDDGIECFGSEYKGRRIGSCGTDVTVFSFTPVRIPNTVDGGAVIFSGKNAYEKGLLIRDCGIDRKRFRDDLGEINEECDVTLNGFSAMMSNVNGYIGREQMKTAGRLLAKHRSNALKWKEKLDGSEYIPVACKDGEPNYWVYGIVTENKRDAIKKFRKDGYYASGVHIKNSIYSVFNDNRDLKGVCEFYSKFVALPCGWWME